ncbi:MAG TPA: cytochrome c [Steroidobacteraceae bacterium]
MISRSLRAWGGLRLPLAAVAALVTTLPAAAGSMTPYPPPPPTTTAQPAAPARDNGPSPARQMVEYRQAVMIILRSNFAPLGGMALGKIPFDPVAAQLRADRVAMLAAMVPDGFVDITRDEKSKARSQIWTNRAGFDGHAKDLVTRAEALANLLKTDPTQSDNFLHAVQALGGACQDCHDDFRSR